MPRELWLIYDHRIQAKHCSFANVKTALGNRLEVKRCISEENNTKETLANVWDSLYRTLSA